MTSACKFCKNGWLDNRFGQDVECINGILIDIDVYHEGYERDLIYPVAPCHPDWQRQLDGEEDVGLDCQERLAR